MTVTTCADIRVTEQGKSSGYCTGAAVNDGRALRFCIPDDL